MKTIAAVLALFLMDSTEAVSIKQLNKNIPENTEQTQIQSQVDLSIGLASTLEEIRNLATILNDEFEEAQSAFDEAEKIEANLAQKRSMRAARKNKKKAQSLITIKNKKKSKDDEGKAPAEVVDEAAAKADAKTPEKDAKKDDSKKEDAPAEGDEEKKEEAEKKEETVAEAKARRLKEIAKLKVADLIAKHKELDSHL